MLIIIWLRCWQSGLMLRDCSGKILILQSPLWALLRIFESVFVECVIIPGPNATSSVALATWPWMISALLTVLRWYHRRTIYMIDSLILVWRCCALTYSVRRAGSHKLQISIVQVAVSVPLSSAASALLHCTVPTIVILISFNNHATMWNIQLFGSSGSNQILLTSNSHFPLACT